MTTTMIETALAGGGGLVKTLRHSYSLSDLSGVQHGPEEALGQDEDIKTGDMAVPGYQALEGEDGTVQMRTVRGRSRAATGYTLSLAGDGEEKWSNRRRKTSSLYGTMPRARAGVGVGPVTRNGTQKEGLHRVKLD